MRATWVCISGSNWRRCRCDGKNTKAAARALQRAADRAARPAKEDARKGDDGDDAALSQRDQALKKAKEKSRHTTLYMC